MNLRSSHPNQFTMIGTHLHSTMVHLFVPQSQSYKILCTYLWFSSQMWATLGLDNHFSIIGGGLVVLAGVSTSLTGIIAALAILIATCVMALPCLVWISPLLAFHLDCLT